MKPGAVLQLCSYADQLAAVQGVAPARMHVALGGSARAVETLRVRDFAAYFRALRRRFETTVGPGGPPPAMPPPATYTEPVAHCDVCRWRLVCDARRRADDHPSLVAGSTAHQRTALAARGVTTLRRPGRAAPRPAHGRHRP